MGDGRAKQAFPLSPLHINMYPLMIEGGIREVVYLLNGARMVPESVWTALKH